MIINYFKNGMPKVEIFNGAVDMVDRLQKEPEMLEGATDIVFRSCEMFANVVKDVQTLLQIGKELIRTEGACAGVRTYWKPSKNFRSKDEVAKIIKDSFKITEDDEIEEIICCMTQPSFFEGIPEREVIEDIHEAILVSGDDEEC